MDRDKFHACIVEGCLDRKSSRHRISVKNQCIKEIWLQRLQNEEIMTFTDEKLYNAIRVCGAHFMDICKKGTRLFPNSLPSVNMPGFDEPATPANSFYNPHKHVTEPQQSTSVDDEIQTNSVTDTILLQEKTHSSVNPKAKSSNLRKLDKQFRRPVPLFDYPHLLKCIRNNMLNKDLIYNYEGRECRAKWAHILQLYEWDTSSKYFSVFTKLTDAHVIPHKIKKMKVSCCTQVFSQSVAKFMLLLIDAESSVISKDAADTANLLLFFDKLFDSVNGFSQVATSGHEMKCAISNNSPHLEYWCTVKKILRSMKFQCSKTGKISIPPSLKNWIQLLSGLEYLWGKLKQSGFKYLVPKNFNQDGLENFFSLIRSHGARNINPRCDAFISSFKSLTINNLLSQKSVSSNCETDQSTGILDDMRSFLLKEITVHQQEYNVVLEYPEADLDATSPYISTYIAGYIAKRVFKKINSCETCMKKLTTSEVQSHHLLIQARRYSSKCLLLPTTEYTNIFNKIIKIICQLIPKYCLCSNISKKITNIIINEIDFRSIICKNHENVKHFLVSETTRLSIFSYTNRVNKIIKGLDTRFTPENLKDPILQLAYKKYCQRRK